MTPGTTAALDRLPTGSILCNPEDVNVRPESIPRTWRKNPDGSWTYWRYGNREIPSRPVSPDAGDYQNLAAWEIHPASPYVITEDLELDDAKETSR